MSEIPALFTVEDFLRASHRLKLPENVGQLRAKPRASGLLDCARSIVYTMTNTPPSNPEEDTDHRDQAFSNEDNRRTEDLTVDVIDAMDGDVAVINRQISVGETGPTTGHPDGDFGIIDGLRWGFEHKKLGRFSYLEVFKKGLMSAKPGYIVQAMVYGKALGWDVVQFVILAEDASSMRYEWKQAHGDYDRGAKKREPAAWTLRDDWNPKVMLPVVDLRPLYGLFPLIEARANALSAAVADGLTGDDIMPEFDGKARFPCDEYCEYRDACRSAGREEGLRVIPRTPFNAG